MVYRRFIVLVASVVAFGAPAFAQGQESPQTSDLPAARAALETVSLGEHSPRRVALVGVAQDSYQCWSAESHGKSPDYEEAAACREDFWSAVRALEKVNKDGTRAAQVQ